MFPDDHRLITDSRSASFQDPERVYLFLHGIRLFSGFYTDENHKTEINKGFPDGRESGSHFTYDFTPKNP